MLLKERKSSSKDRKLCGKSIKKKSIKCWLQAFSLSHNVFNRPLFKPFPNAPFLDCPKVREAAEDNWNVAIKGF